MTAPSDAGKALGITPTNRAVIEQRAPHSRSSLNFFPTPPWATRALCEIVLPRCGYADLSNHQCWEPACGEGHMSEVLAEYFLTVCPSDVHDYGKVDQRVGSFVGDGDLLGDLIDAPAPYPLDFTITNPPFKLAEAFIERGLRESSKGVAMLMRTSFIETSGRFDRIFSKHPLRMMAPFAERVPMHEGRWEADGDSMTSYAWFVWLAGYGGPTELMIIPPGQRKRLERPDDRARFAFQAPEESLL